MELRSRTIGRDSITFPIIPEIIEQCLSYLDSESLLQARKVCKPWNTEACRVLRKRKDFEISWGGGDGVNHVKELRAMLRKTQNPELFNGCSIENSYRLRMATTLFQDFGTSLRHVTVDLGLNFPIRYHSQNLDSIYKLVTQWGPNIDWMEVSMQLEVLKRLNNSILQQSEVYSPKVSHGKVTRLRHLEINGILGPFFPEFSHDLIQSSPNLLELVMKDVPPDRCRLVYFGQSIPSQRNLQFLEQLQRAPDITTNLKEFRWSLTSQLLRDIYFDPVTEVDGNEVATKLVQVQFGRLETLILDGSALGKEQVNVESTKELLRKNPNLRNLRLDPCSQDAPLTIIIQNQPLPQPIILNVSMHYLKRLSIHSIKGKALDLFTTVSHLPNLEVLDVRKLDPNHYIFYLNISCFFRAQFSLKDSPHTSLKKLVFEYPFEKIEDLHAVFDSFPNLEHFESPLCFGERFLFGPREIIGDVSFVESIWVIHRILANFARKIRTLKLLRVISHPEIHLVGNWIKALKIMKRLKGLQQLQIDCRYAQKKLYVKKLKCAVKHQKTSTFPIQVLPIVQYGIF